MPGVITVSGRGRPRPAAPRAIVLAGPPRPPRSTAVFSNVAGQVLLQVNLTETRAAGLLQPVAYAAPFRTLVNVVNGTGAGQLDQLYGQLLALAGAPQTIDLRNFTDIAQATGVSAARCRVLAIQNQAAPGSMANLVFGGAAASPWTGFLNAAGTLTLPPSGILLILDPLSVGPTAGGITSPTSRNLMLDPGGNNFAVAVVLGCASVA